ncbi:hypothetical protein H2200_008881 [Cladophialophora chaetospira]|uniref:Uncharacterized protein n=1 Tax=Cladophialophora chaetospira TaxID=386627 RepID=A0AA38X514_9EURO|nr:hypothetical protein H2200_008881 [Cladophialophora chaetospira]
MADATPATAAELKQQQKSLFLAANFTDIRFMVFDTLRHVPEFRRYPEDEPPEYNSPQYEKYVDEWNEGLDRWEAFLPVLVTRKNLRLVCKQIEEEWAPIFFRSTTFYLSESGCFLSDGRYHDRSPQAFEAKFLKCISGDKMRNLRRLEYDGGSRARAIYPPRAPHEKRWPNMTFRAGDKLKKLATMLLRHQDHLQLEALNVVYDVNAQGSLYRQEEISQADLMTLSGRHHDRYYIGDFVQRMSDTTLRGASVTRLLRDGAYYGGKRIEIYFRRSKRDISREEAKGNGAQSGKKTRKQNRERTNARKRPHSEVEE